MNLRPLTIAILLFGLSFVVPISAHAQSDAKQKTLYNSSKSGNSKPLYIRPQTGTTAKKTQRRGKSSKQSIKPRSFSGAKHRVVSKGRDSYTEKMKAIQRTSARRIEARVESQKQQTSLAVARFDERKRRERGARIDTGARRKSAAPAPKPMVYEKEKPRNARAPIRLFNFRNR